MGLILQNQNHFTREELLNKVDDASIFGYYFGNFNFSKSYASKFRQDSNPSTGFYVNNRGRIIYNDLRTGEKLDCFAFVAKLHNINYGEAIQKIASDFGLTGTKAKPAAIINAVKQSETVKKDTIIDITYNKWDFAALNYWKDYGITQEELEKNNVFNVATLKINGNFIPNYRLNLRFAYVINFKNKTYKKIYEPHAEKKYKWFNSIPLFIPFGYNELNYTTDTLIIQKSQKDRIITLKFHPDVIAVQNESKAALRDTTLNFLKTKYKRIVCIFDNDERGKEACQEYSERGCECYHLPENLYEQGIKDMGDVVKKWGLDTVKKWLKTNNII